MRLPKPGSADAVAMSILRPEPQPREILCEVWSEDDYVDEEW